MPRRTEYLRYRYGICLKEDCPLCQEKAVQQILARKDFLCEECGKPLRECPPPKHKTYKKTITALCLLALAAAVAAVCYFHIGRTQGPPLQAPHPSTVGADLVSARDTVGSDLVSDRSKEQKQGSSSSKVIEKTVIIEKHYIEKTKPAPKPEPAIEEATGPKIPYGIYSGPANGIGGKVRVTSSYALSLRDADGTILNLQPGDEIQQTKFQGNDLRQGIWVQQDGTRQFFTR